jgi:molybdenum cofactor biosynthesis protein B
MSFKKHRSEAPTSIKVGVVVVSDSRFRQCKEGKDSDVSGRIIEKWMRRMGHEVERVIVPDSQREISRVLRSFLKSKEAVIFTGGTGIASRDVTIETVEPMLEKKLPGFGEILRKIGYEKVGAPALLTRATAGVLKKRVIFCLPGAPNAVKIAMRIIAPEIAHLVKHARE